MANYLCAKQYEIMTSRSVIGSASQEPTKFPEHLTLHGLAQQHLMRRDSECFACLKNQAYTPVSTAASVGTSSCELYESCEANSPKHISNPKPPNLNPPTACSARPKAQEAARTLPNPQKPKCCLPWPTRNLGP